MKLWNMVEKTNPNQTKKITFGRKFTAIDQMSQVKKATEVFGSYGIEWFVKDEQFTIIGEREASICLYTALLAYKFDGKAGGFPIHSDIALYPLSKGKPRYNDDWSKKVATDAMTKGLSKLGFNADVFMGLFDDNKYVQQMQHEFSGNSPQNTPQQPDWKGWLSQRTELKEVFKSKGFSGQYVEKLITENEFDENKIRQALEG